MDRTTSTDTTAALPGHPRPSRRGLLGSAAALLGAAGLAGGAGATEPDAELIALCGEFDALEHRINAFFVAGATPILDDDERDEIQEPLKDRQDELLGRICALRATTDAGIKARAATLVLYAADLVRGAEDEDEYTDSRMLAALLRDMTAQRGA